MSFRSPQRKSCVAILRDCAQRHSLLPETIVVDNGKEFESIFFEACLARLGIHKQARPPGDPRFGSSIERLFGVLKEELLLTLPGNTSNDAKGRSVSPSHRGAKGAALTLEEVYELVQSYLFEHFNNHCHGTRHESPSESVRAGLARFGCSGIPISPNPSFYITTAVEVPIAPLVDAQRGIRHNGRWYTSPRLQGLPNRSRVEIREEPFNDTAIYALVRNEWIVCRHGPTLNPAVEISYRTI